MARVAGESAVQQEGRGLTAAQVLRTGRGTGDGTRPIVAAQPDVYHDQAERFDRVADQCSIAELVPYYRKMAFDYLAHAVRADTAAEKAAPGRSIRRKRAAQG